MYHSPSVVEYGLSKNLVKGDCGFGGDVLFIGATNKKKWNVMDCRKDGICIWVKTVCAEKKPYMPCSVAGNDNPC